MNTSEYYECRAEAFSSTTSGDVAILPTAYCMCSAPFVSSDRACAFALAHTTSYQRRAHGARMCLCRGKGAHIKANACVYTYMYTGVDKEACIHRLIDTWRCEGVGAQACG